MENESREKYIKEKRQRSDAGKKANFNQEEITLIGENAQDGITASIADLLKNRNFRRDMKENFLQSLQETERTGEAAKRLFLVGFMRGITTFSYREDVEKALQEENYKAYVFWFDVVRGFEWIFGSVLRAEHANSDEENELNTEALLLTQETDQIYSMQDQIAAMKDMKIMNDRLTSLLKDDPTGISVVDYSLEYMKESQSSDFPASIPEFLVAGASAAAFAYKEGHKIITEK